MRSPRPSPPPLSESSPRKTSQSPRRRAGTRRRCCVRDTWGPVRFEVGATPRPHPTCAPTCNPRPHRTGAQCTFRRNHPRHTPPAPQHAIRARTEQAHNALSGATPPTTPHLRPNRQSAPGPNRRTMHFQAHHPRPHPTCAPTGNPRPHRTGAQCTFRRTCAGGVRFWVGRPSPAPHGARATL